MRKILLFNSSGLRILPGGAMLRCICFVAETYHPASCDSFADSIKGVFLHGFFSLGLGDVIVGEVLASAAVLVLMLGWSCYLGEGCIL